MFIHYQPKRAVDVPSLRPGIVPAYRAGAEQELQTTSLALLEGNDAWAIPGGQ
jgi:hypothetical protein